MTSLDDLLSAIPSTEDREEVRRLARESKAARGPAREEKVDQILERVKWGLRAARYPLPTREDIERMISE